MAHGKPSVSELRAGEALIQVGLWGPGPRPRPLPGRREGRGWLLSHTRPLHGLSIQAAGHTAITIVLILTCIVAPIVCIVFENGRLNAKGDEPPPPKQLIDTLASRIGWRSAVPGRAGGRQCVGRTASS